jgi:hypothetical protein
LELKPNGKLMQRMNHTAKQHRQGLCASLFAGQIAEGGGKNIRPVGLVKKPLSPLERGERKFPISSGLIRFRWRKTGEMDFLGTLAGRGLRNRLMAGYRRCRR